MNLKKKEEEVDDHMETKDKTFDYPTNSLFPYMKLVLTKLMEV